MHSVVPKSRTSQEPPTTVSLDHACGSWPAELLGQCFLGQLSSFFLQDLSTNTMESEAMERPWKVKPVENQQFAGHLSLKIPQNLSDLMGTMMRIVAIHWEWTSGFGCIATRCQEVNPTTSRGRVELTDTKSDVVQN